MDGLIKSTETNEKEEEFSFKNFLVPLTTLKALHIIILIGIVVFANGLLNGFVLDDTSQIVDNPLIHTINNFFITFSGSTFSNGQFLAGQYYRPLVSINNIVVYSLFGANAFPYHLLQIILVITNACLLFIVLKHFFKLHIALILALIFLVHPMNSELAFYIAKFQETLYFFFGILALLLVLNRQTKKSLMISSLLLFFSLLSKETGILFSIISLIYVFLFNRKVFYSFLRNILIVVIVYFLLRTHAIGLFNQFIPNSPIETLALPTRIINIPAIFLFYTKTFFFPFKLSETYYWVYTTIDGSHVIIPFIIDVAFLLVISLPLWFYRKKSLDKKFLLYTFFFVWFLLGLLMHIQLIPLDLTVATGWFYFPMVGILGMLGAVLSDNLHTSNRNLLFVIVAVTVIALFSWRTIVRGFEFRDDFTLATHDLTITPDSYTLENSLSYEYIKRGQYDLAILHAKKSVQEFPFFINYLNLGGAYFHLGKYKEAKKAFEDGLKSGDYYILYENLATLSLVYGNPHDNIAFLKNVVTNKFPQDARLWLCLAVLEYRYGNKDNAKTYIQNAYELDNSPSTYYYYVNIMNNQPLNVKINE